MESFIEEFGETMIAVLFGMMILAVFSYAWEVLLCVS